MTVQSLKHFAQMWENYPDDGKDGDATAQAAGALAVKHRIGGAVDAAWITDTCTLRLSRALNYSDQPVPHGFAGLRTVAGADKKWYAYAVLEMEQYLRTTYGHPQMSRGAAGALGVSTTSFSGKKGIVGFDLRAYFRQENYRGQATGHLDLWNGTECRYENYFAAATTVYFWPVGL
jgi:Type VI secretion system (T6SS), amidase effector protein 4